MAPASDIHSPLGRTLREGDIIEVRGYVHSDNPTRFDINLQEGSSHPSSDVIVHFNPRFDVNKVIRNYKKNGNWHSPEDRSGGFPFQAGGVFLIKVTVLGDKKLEFDVSGDGGHEIFIYNTHVSVGDADHFSSHGDATFTSVNHIIKIH